MTWPDLYGLRRHLFPAIDQKVPEGWKFVVPVRESEHVGVWNVSPSEARRTLRERDGWYVNNFASAKYMEPKYAPFNQTSREVPDGKPTRVWGCGSYAYRPEGRFGAWQIHVRLFPHPNGVFVVAHRELNPLAAPARHHSGETVDDPAGVRAVQTELLTDVDASWNNTNGK